jgi:zinc protease
VSTRPRTVLSRAAATAVIAAAVAAASGVLGACASARPEAALAVTREDGRVVPLDSATAEFTVGGVRVIHRANFATEVVAANLYLLGGARQLTPATQGVETLLLHAAEYGSAGYPGASSRAAWGATGSDLLIAPGPDWTRYGFRGVRADFDSSWAVLADRVMRPTLAARAVAVTRARLVARVRQQRADPDGLAFLLADSVAHAGHPYALRPEGTESSLAALDSAALARYHAEHVVTSRMLLVVVGGVDRATVEAAVARTLARLPRGAYAWTLPPAAAPAPAGPAGPTGPAARVHRPAATNYLLGLFPGPVASSPDAPAFRLATALLSSRISRAVREQRGLSYAAYAPYLDRGARAGGVYVSTAAPAAALAVIRAQLDSLRRESYPAAAMQFFVRQFVTDYIGEHLTSADQADFLARAALYQGDWRKASEEMDALRRVTGGAVSQAARRYLSRPRFVYVGDTTRVTRQAFVGF